MLIHDVFAYKHANEKMIYVCISIYIYIYSDKYINIYDPNLQCSTQHSIQGKVVLFHSHYKTDILL